MELRTCICFRRCKIIINWKTEYTFRRGICVNLFLLYKICNVWNMGLRGQVLLLIFIWETVCNMKQNCSKERQYFTLSHNEYWARWPTHHSIAMGALNHCYPMRISSLPWSISSIEFIEVYSVKLLLLIPSFNIIKTKVKTKMKF